MQRNSPSTARAVLLLLILVVGPLKAQSVFACAMMDEVRHGECCCVGPPSDEDCADAGCDGVLNSNDEPCCERSVEVTLDDEARQDAPIIKPVEVRSDVDPPTPIVTSFDTLEPTVSCLTVSSSLSLPDVGPSGSDTYLITQRLRI